ncbi:hypothetical protein [Desulfosporosinus acididurans]|nr:hypothetical protein [Desulfosporosinus acididurans]
MAHIEVCYRCPLCRKAYGKQSDAITCRNSHPIETETWAVGKGGKGVRIFEHCALDGLGGLRWALREADLSDDIKIRAEQLEEG